MLTRKSDAPFVQSLAALAHPTRLAVFRRLVAAGPEGLAAGEIARLLNVPHNTLSTHLAELSAAGLVNARRAGRSILYSAEFDGVARLVSHLVEDCCGGRPELCGDRHPVVMRISEIIRNGKARQETAMYNVLILCTGNTSRSILAEAILNKLGEGRIRAFSAGSTPKGTVRPEAMRLLDKLGYDISSLRSKSWHEFAKPGSPEMDFVFTVCDDAHGEACPVWPGTPVTAHWGIEDPAKATGNAAEIAVAYEQAYRFLHNRISVFLALPIESLDRMSLHARLREIGSLEGATGKAKDQQPKAAAAE